MTGVYIHELGHNLGMNHASTDQNNDGEYESEYGDYSCPMGGSYGHKMFNAPHMHRQQWIPSNKIIDVDEISSEFTIAPLHIEPNQTIHPQILRIKRKEGGHYYLSYRLRQGYDEGLWAKYSNGLSLHHHPGYSRTLFIDKLSSGESWKTQNLIIHQKSEEDGNLQITIDKNPCGSLIAGMSPGIAVLDRNAQMRIILQNPSLECDTRNLSFIFQAPDKISGRFDQENIVLNKTKNSLVHLDLLNNGASGLKNFTIDIMEEKNGKKFFVSTAYGSILIGNHISLKPGFQRSLYQGTWSRLPDFTQLVAKSSEIRPSIDLENISDKYNYGTLHKGILKIIDEGVYSFYLTSDDGSQLFINEQLVVDNDGLHGKQEKIGSIFLGRGRHSISTHFFQKGGAASLSLKFQGGAYLKQDIPPNLIEHLYSSLEQNIPPTAYAGEDMTIKLGQQIELSGQAKDPDGVITFMGWEQLTAPLKIIDDQEKRSTLSFEPMEKGLYIFRFLVKDNHGAWGADDVHIEVTE